MKKSIIAIAIIVMIIIVGGYKLKSPNFSALFSKNNNLTQEEAKTKVTDYINNNLMQPGTTVDIKNITEEGELYKVDISVQGQEITAYMTKDGNKFFPNMMDMNKVADNADNNADETDNNTAPAENISQTEKPSVELFVMSYCPYGTQMEKGILPVMEALGDSIDFQLKFVDYAMHDKKEIDENLRQHCIGKNEPAKLNNYLSCFLKGGQGTEEACMAEADIDSIKTTSCVSATDEQFKITQGYNDKSTWNNGQFPQFNIDKADNEKYGVQGSPTLVINGTVSKSSRDSASLLKTICSAFNEVPEACNQELSSAAPSPGFGEGTGSASDASCGS